MSRLIALALLAAVLLAGCGGSKPRGPSALLFVSTKDRDYAIFGADADGKHVRRLSKQKGDPSTPSGLFFQVEPTWSPDGTRIAFVSRRDGRSHVYVMNADGGDARRLTGSAQDDDHPSWSPDGSRVVFSREGAIFAIPARGGAVRRIGRGFGNAADPAWSPDGARIAYDYRVPGDAAREIYVMNADGTGVRKLTRLGRTSSLPAWSPDGSVIAFQSDAGTGHSEIYTVGADGSGVRRVTLGDTDAIDPTWSPKGELTYARDGAIWSNVDGKEFHLVGGAENDSSPAWRPVQAK